MRWYFGYPVLAAGLAFGAHVLFPGDRHDLAGAAPGDAPLEVTRDVDVARDALPAVVAARDLHESPRSRLAAFSPGAQLLSVTVPPPRPSMFDYLSQAFAASASPQPAHVELAAFGAVDTGPWKSAVVPIAAETAEDKAAATTDDQKGLLARDVQRELQRVGCYLGEIDGVWGPGSQRAAMAFMERVNAMLPANEPDVFMLSLLTAQQNAVCGTHCPHNQALSAGGRCLPTTLLAHNDSLEPVLQQGPTRASRAQRDSLVPVAANDGLGVDGEWSTVVAEVDMGAARPSPFHGRMSIGGPKPDLTETEGVRFRRTVSLSTDSFDRDADDAVLPVSVTTERPSMDVIAPRRPPTRADARPAPPPRARPTKTSSRDRKAWRKNYRQVQHLFENPLGRM